MWVLFKRGRGEKTRTTCGQSGSRSHVVPKRTHKHDYLSWQKLHPTNSYFDNMVFDFGGREVSIAENAQE